MKIRPLYLLNVILTIVLLTSLLASPINRSGTATTPTVTAEYDPFKDMNEDGVIDLLDLVKVAGAFDTSGDPTKNVYVTNWPVQQSEPSWTAYKYRNFNMSLSGGSYSGVWGFSDGYSRMYIAIDSWSVEVSESVYNKTVNIQVNEILWSLSYDTAARIRDMYWYFGTLPLNITYHNTKAPQWSEESSNPAEVKVKGPYFDFLPSVYSPDTSIGWISFDVWVYLRNE